MGACYSLRARLLGPDAAPRCVVSGAEREADRAENGREAERELRQWQREEEHARRKAEQKRSRSIDKRLKAEKREYKQTHRLLLLEKP